MKPSPLIMTELSLKKTFLRAFTLLLVFLSFVASEVTNIDCRDDVSFTSPNYPSNYPNGAIENRLITAPNGSRILVTFADFDVEDDDFLNLADKVDKQNFKRYTGEEMDFPPFLTKGNELEMTFISFSSGTRRGFNVSTSCYDHSRDANVARIVGGNSPGKGFLEIRTQLDEWRRVCKDSFNERVAEVVCGEPGYPAVRKVSYGTDDCMSAGQDCIETPICNDDTFRLEDCSWPSGNCTSADAVKVECYEPGYKGCYDRKELPQQNGFMVESTSQCVSSCRAITREALAIMTGKLCFCSSADEVNLPDITRTADPSTCIQNTQDTQRVNDSLVYDVSVGFCDELDDVIHGSWDSKITWFGSIVHLMCDDGYSLNKSGTLQCVPGLSPYYPIWNGSLPSCDMLEDGTNTSSKTDALNPDDGTNTSSKTDALNPDDGTNTSSKTDALNPDEDPKTKIGGPTSWHNFYIWILIIVILLGFLLGVLLKARIGNKLSASLSSSRITYTLDRLSCQSVEEMSETEQEKHCSSRDGRESPSGHKRSLPMVQVYSKQV